MPKPSILAVDDNDAHRYFVCHTLEKAGFEIIPAQNGQTALEEARKRPDLVLLDVQLPDMSGFEVCRRLKAQEETRAIPVIMFSSVAQNGDSVNSARQLGAASFLFFPMSPEQLLMVVEGQLKKANSARAPDGSSDI